MSRLIAAGVLGPGRPSLEEQLEASVCALENGARFVPSHALPTETDLNMIHAQLARVCRLANGEEMPPCT